MAVEENICRFLPKFENYNFFNIINLVYETEAPNISPRKVTATFRIHLITDGSGVFHTDKTSVSVKKGDVIVMPPAKPFAINNTEELKYIYVSYLGVRANMLAEEYKIGSHGSVYNGYEYLIPIWLRAFDKERENANVCCEGIVLYTFSEIGNAVFEGNKAKAPKDAAEKIKDLIDERFTDPELTLEAIAAALSYHPKYASTAFKKRFDIRLCDYIRTLRIQHACTLIDQGLTSLKNIAYLCGYEDSLYFSSVFKKQMGISPKEHIKRINEYKSRKENL